MGFRDLSADAGGCVRGGVSLLGDDDHGEQEPQASKDGAVRPSVIHGCPFHAGSAFLKEHACTPYPSHAHPGGFRQVNA